SSRRALSDPGDRARPHEGLTLRVSPGGQAGWIVTDMLRSAGRFPLLRDGEAERAADSRSAAHGDFSAVCRGDVLHDRESESGASAISRARLVDTIEAFEHAGLIGFGDALPGVLDFTPHRAPVVTRAHD